MAEGSKRDRELIELLNELRVVLPGVQVLFAFLLTVPFTQAFPKLSTLERNAYFVAFVCSAAASALLIAPSAFHRIRFRDRDKEQMLQISNKLTIAGMVLLAIGMNAAVFVISEILFGVTWASVVTALIGALFLWFWFGLPIMREVRDND